MLCNIKPVPFHGPPLWIRSPPLDPPMNTISYNVFYLSYRQKLPAAMKVKYDFSQLHTNKVRNKETNDANIWDKFCTNFDNFYGTLCGSRRYIGSVMN